MREALHLAQQVGARPEGARPLLAMGIIRTGGHGQHALGGACSRRPTPGRLPGRPFRRPAGPGPPGPQRRRQVSPSRARALVGRALDTAREGATPPAGLGRGRPCVSWAPRPWTRGRRARPWTAAGAGDAGGAGAPGAATPGLPGARRPCWPWGSGTPARGPTGGPPPGPATGAWHADGDALAGLARAAMAQGAPGGGPGARGRDHGALAGRGADRPAGDPEPGDAICLACHVGAPRPPATERLGRRAASPPGTACSWSAPPALPPVERQGYLEGVPVSPGPLAGLGGAPGRRPRFRPLARFATARRAVLLPPPGPPPRPVGAAAGPLTSGGAPWPPAARPEEAIPPPPGDAVLKRTSRSGSPPAVASPAGATRAPRGAARGAPPGSPGQRAAGRRP